MTFREQIFPLINSLDKLRTGDKIRFRVRALGEQMNDVRWCKKTYT